MESLKTQLYQMFILGFEGEIPKGKILELLKEGLCGVILFSKNIKSFTNTKHATNKIKTYSKINPFISIDQEGGRVERTENLFEGKKFLSAKFACSKGENYIRNQTKEISSLLKQLGFNLNFAPVLDVNTNPKNPIIGERSFSSNVDEVIKFGKIVIDEYLKNGIVPCSKHFPGHGDASMDSHLTLPEINLDIENFEKNHIKAFKEVISPMIMVAHLHCKAFDKEKIPSSISKNVLDYLKQNINYDPLIITDDMEMNGILQYQDPVNNVITAIRNGVNIILYRNCDDKTIKIIEKVYDRIEKDSLLKENVENSFKKILKFKNEYLNK